MNITHMARLFRALRRSSAPEATSGNSSGRQPMSFIEFLNQNVAPLIENNKLNNGYESEEPVREMLLSILDRLDSNSDDDDECDGIDETSNDDQQTMASSYSTWWLNYLNHWDSVSRHITEHDVINAIWGRDSNHIWRAFVRIRARMARDQTFSPELKHNISKANGMSSMIKRLKNITMADLVLPELAGWLLDQSEKNQVWCVVADMLFCVFETDKSEIPDDVIILPGCSIRSLVYRTAKPQKSNSKTISGIDRYQIIVDDCTSKKKHTFSVESPSELNKWMKVLKSASNLDSDLESSPDLDYDQRRHSMFAGLLGNSEQGEFVTPRYIPSTTDSHREDRLSKTWDPGSLAESNKNVETERRSHDYSHGRFSQGNSIDNIRKKLRRETDLEKSKPTPMKAKHFESSQTNQKRPGPFKKIRSFGSLESLFKPKRKSEESSETKSLEDRRYSQGTINSKNSSSSSSLETANNESPLVRSAARRSLSSSLEFGRSGKKSSKGLMRTSSDVKDRMKSNKSSEETIQLQDLHNASICGFLQYKFLIKWQKIFCIVNRGRLYGFKTQSPDEEAFMSLPLSNCNILYTSDYDKRYKKQFVFKVSQNNKKGVYLSAPDKTELSRWLQVMQMEANKVQGDSDFLDSSMSLSDACSSSISTGLNSLDTSQESSDISSPKILSGSVQSDSSSKESPIFLEQQRRRFSMPSTLYSGSDADYQSTSSSEVPDGMECDSPGKRFGLPDNDLPEHDPALKHVWQKDHNYLLNMVRAKLRTSKKKTDNESITNKHLPGPNNEGLMVMSDDHKNFSDRKPKGSRDIRRTMSFHGPNSNSKSADVASDSPCSSPSSKKRHKPLAVKKLAARDLEDCAMSGYMERRSFSGTWIKYWYLLKEGTIFCYLTPDDNVTVDILNLQGHKIAYLVDKFKGKRFVLQISHDEYMSTYYSVESREDMNAWLDALQTATGVPPSPHGIIDEQDSQELISDTQAGNQCQEKYQTVKHKLLAEMLRQKHELERKQATRNKKQNGNSSPQDASDTLTEEDQIRDVTRLRQRRMSAQIKMDTIQKQMQPVSTSTRKFPFKLGGKKKVQENNNEHLQEQLRELTDKLHQIDRDLYSHNVTNHEVLDMNQNRKSNSKSGMDDEDKYQDNSFTTSNGDVNRSNALNIKASVQKFAQKTKTISKSVKNKNKKSNNNNNGSPIINGYISDLSSTWSGPVQTSEQGQGRLFDDHEDDSEAGSDSYRSDSFTDLTKDKRQSMGDESVFLDNYECNGSNRTLNKISSNPTSPRKEIDPGILAEIDAFEDFTRQVLSARSTTS